MKVLFPPLYTCLKFFDTHFNILKYRYHDKIYIMCVESCKNAYLVDETRDGGFREGVGFALNSHTSSNTKRGSSSKTTGISYTITAC